MKYIDADKLIATLERQNVDKKAIQPLIRIIDSLQQEQHEEPDKSLKEAAEEYIKNGRYLPEAFFVRPAFIAGADWQASQMPMPEDTVLFQKGVVEGRRLEREDMLGDAEECELYWDGDFLAIDLNMVALGYSEKDKVKVIVLKDESK